MREIMLVEARWRERFCGQESEDHHLFVGIRPRSNLCVMPELEDWIAEELRKEPKRR